MTFVCSPDQLAKEFARELDPDLAKDPVVAGTIAEAGRHIAARQGGDPDWSRLDVLGLFLAFSEVRHCDMDPDVAVDVARILSNLYEWLGRTGRLDTPTARRRLEEILKTRDAFVGRVFVDKLCGGWELVDDDLALTPVDPSDTSFHDDNCPICRQLKEEFPDAPRFRFEIPEIEPCDCAICQAAITRSRISWGFEEHGAAELN